MSRTATPHAKPTEVGHTATAAGAAALLLSHIMPELEDEQDDIRPPTSALKG